MLFASTLLKLCKIWPFCTSGYMKLVHLPHVFAGLHTSVKTEALTFKWECQTCNIVKCYLTQSTAKLPSPENPDNTVWVKLELTFSVIWHSQ